MKLNLLMTVLVLMVMGSITVCDQCSVQEDVFTIPTNPFYTLTSSEEGIGLGAFIGVNITYPINGTTYYFSTQWLNTTIYGDGTPPYTCWYRTSGSWNTYNCENQSVTFPPGEVLVTVMVEDDNGDIGYGYALFYIYERVDNGALVYEDLLAFLFGGSILLSFMFFADRRRKKRVY